MSDVIMFYHIALILRDNGYLKVILNRNRYNYWVITHLLSMKKIYGYVVV